MCLDHDWAGLVGAAPVRLLSDTSTVTGEVSNVSSAWLVGWQWRWRQHDYELINNECLLSRVDDYGQGGRTFGVWSGHLPCWEGCNCHNASIIAEVVSNHDVIKNKSIFAA